MDVVKAVRTVITQDQDPAQLTDVAALNIELQETKTNTGSRGNASYNYDSWLLLVIY